MRLCANENVPEVCIHELRRAGHDVLWIREASPGSSDIAVLSRSQAESRVLITFDKDFGDIVFHSGKSASHGIILFRTRDLSPVLVASQMTAVISSRSDWAGHYTVVEPHSIRMRKLL